MFTEIENIDTGVKYQIELPTKCPFCGVSLSPRIEGKLFRRPTKLCTDVFMYAYLILFCPNCDDRFYAKYTIPDNGPSRRVAVYPVSKPKISLPTILREKYPDFWEAYRQAVIAEANNLNPLCGMGYRRALEILTKQHLIDHYDKTEAEIMKLDLAKCYNQLDNKEKALARGAAWLGNDYAHMENKHPDYDITDLKNFINSLALMVSAYLTAEEADKVPRAPR